MKGLMLQILLFTVLLLISTGQGMAIEQLKYKVIEKEGSFELRQYDDHFVAGTKVEGKAEDAGNIAFGRLFKYISGNNQKKESISMTAPVTQETSAEKIAMTAPVTQEKKEGEWWVCFVMPSKYTLGTLPKPTDTKVEIQKVSGKKVACITYSGTWSRERYERREKKLREWIKKKGWKIVGEPVWSRYDPPFKPWFLRRNEIWIKVE